MLQIFNTIGIDRYVFEERDEWQFIPISMMQLHACVFPRIDYLKYTGIQFREM